MDNIECHLSYDEIDNLFTDEQYDSFCFEEVSQQSLILDDVIKNRKGEKK